MQQNDNKQEWIVNLWIVICEQGYTFICMVQVIAGKGHETYQMEGEKRDFFDDREECREALQYVDELHQAGIDTSEFPWR